MHLLASSVVESTVRSAGLWSAYVEGARTEPALASAYAARMDEMREGARRVLDRAVAEGLCPAPADAARAVDAIWVVLHPSQFVLLVTYAHWTRQQYQAWMEKDLLAVFDG